jgi:hypothetical protein
LFRKSAIAYTEYSRFALLLSLDEISRGTSSGMNVGWERLSRLQLTLMYAPTGRW